MGGSSGGRDAAGTGGIGGAGETCPGCRIDGECVAEGKRNPNNSCETCDPSRNPEGWAPDDGRACDDGLFCTVEDVCQGAVCKGVDRVCDDGIACNGVATCDEKTRSCKDGVNRCAGQICDLVSDRCVPSCTGCSIAGQCVPSGRESPDNPCLVCAPSVSASAYSPAPNGTSCDDGLYCSTESRCQAGSCVATAQRTCAANERCDETTAACVCAGCKIGANCVASGAVNPSNPCQICKPSASAVSYSVNAGANCGSAATECSAQDTCSASGSCQPNHLADGAPCSGGECVSGACQALVNPFDCVVPSPPPAELPASVFSASGSPPAARGGTIAAGRYAPSRIDIYSSGIVPTISVRTFEFSKNFVQVAMRPFSPETGVGYIPQIEFVGTFTTSGNQIAFAVDRCDPNYNIDVPSLMYTASANGFTTIEPLNDEKGTWVATSFVRQ